MQAWSREARSGAAPRVPRHACDRGVRREGGLPAGRRDDLWSWLYLLVEMLAGGLPWREPGGRGEPGDGGEPGDAPGREAAKAAVLAHKQRCLARPADLGGGAPLQGAPPPPGIFLPGFSCHRPGPLAPGAGRQSAWAGPPARWRRRCLRAGRQRPAALGPPAL